MSVMVGVTSSVANDAIMRMKS